MKIKTSITLSKELIDTLAVLYRKETNRSELIERIIWEYLKYYKQLKRDAQDARILNEKADKINKEAMDVLSYQVEI